MEFFIKWVSHWTPAALQISNEIPKLTSKNVFLSKFGKHRGPGVCRFSLILGCMRGEIFPAVLCAASVLHSSSMDILREKHEVGISGWAGGRCYLHRQTDSRSRGPVTYSESGQIGSEETGVGKKEQREPWCHLGWPHNESVLSSICNARDVLFRIVCACVDLSQRVVW